MAIAGIAAVTNDAPATGGYDEESDDELRERYYNDLRNPNNGGNQQAYIAWALSVPGVGRVRIFPQALGGQHRGGCASWTLPWRLRIVA